MIGPHATPEEIRTAVLGLWQLGSDTAEIAHDLELPEAQVLGLIEAEQDRRAAERGCGAATPAGAARGSR